MKLNKDSIADVVRWQGTITLHVPSAEDDLLHGHFLNGEPTKAGLFDEFGYAGRTIVTTRRVSTAKLASARYTLEAIYTPNSGAKA